MRVEPISGVSSIIPVIPVLPVRKIKKIEKTRRSSGVAFVSDLRQTIEEEIRTEYEQKYQALLNNSPQAQAERLEKQMELMRAVQTFGQIACLAKKDISRTIFPRPNTAQMPGILWHVIK